MDDLKCHGCSRYLEPIGSFLACASQDCQRFAIPVNHRGLTDEEAQVEAIAPLIPSDEGAESEDEVHADGFR